MSRPARLLGNLTEYEVLALESRHNLSDGHRHFSPTPAERRIVDSLPAIWRAADRASQGAADAALIGRDAAEVQTTLAAAGVHVLPGHHFFWANPFLRVALARDPAPFAAAVRTLVARL